MRNLLASDLFTDSELRIIVGVSRHDNRLDVDVAYGAGTYDRLFPEPDEEEMHDDEGPDPHDLEVENDMEREARENGSEWE